MREHGWLASGEGADRVWRCIYCPAVVRKRGAFPENDTCFDRPGESFVERPDEAPARWSPAWGWSKTIAYWALIAWAGYDLWRWGAPASLLFLLGVTLVLGEVNSFAYTRGLGLLECLTEVDASTIESLRDHTHPTLYGPAGLPTKEEPGDG